MINEAAKKNLVCSIGNRTPVLRKAVKIGEMRAPNTAVTEVQCCESTLLNRNGTGSECYFGSTRPIRLRRKRVLHSTMLHHHRLHPDLTRAGLHSACKMRERSLELNTLEPDPHKCRLARTPRIARSRLDASQKKRDSKLPVSAQVNRTRVYEIHRLLSPLGG